ncbi:Hypothetical predicted protein [Olea europaea subsp. europaea]|uniref:Agenet domain-containing protein n=2 Tax=Olea europaea subsp. europaea TaxID=158383 RepID=A0A8S0R739_OLEEU|nr:Hypothetical predicted protein [Olea europaea subsp. europaea]
MVGLMFDGRKLEVSFDIEDCGDAWFPTTIREYLGNLSFLVEYWSKKIGDKAQNLKVNTTSLHIRPCPPVLEDKRFTLFEKVEAFFDFGWWSGVITKELEDSRYIVFLKQIKKHKKFHQSELRPHMEWKNGKWFTSSQGVSILSSDNGNEGLKPKCADGNAVSVLVGSSGNRKDNSEEEIPCSLNSRENQIKQSTPPQKKFKEENVVSVAFMAREKSSEECDHVSVNPASLSIGTNSREQHAAMDQSSYEPSRGKIIIKQSAKAETIQKRKRGRTPKRFIKGSQAPVTDNGQSGDVASDGMVTQGGIPNSVDSLRNAEVVVTRTEASLPNQESIVLNEDYVELIKGQPEPINSVGDMTNIPFVKYSDKNVVKDSINACEKHSSKRRKMLIIDSSSRGKTTELNCIMKEVEKVIAEVPHNEDDHNEDDNELLSNLNEEMHGPSTFDTSRILPVRTMEQCMVSSKKQEKPFELTNRCETHKGSGMQASGFEDNGAIVLSEQQILPFVKKNVLWKTIESMEIFGKAPQKPHFQPLEHFKESLREGLAIGYMVTFASVVEKASKLLFNDPKSIMVDILETLSDLEKYGFDVGVVRDRVLELIAMKDKHEKLLSQVEELNSQIAQQNLEKSKIDEEIGKISTQIIELQKKLSLAESSKELKGQAIASLQSRLEEIEENIRTAEFDFEGLAARPL